MSDATVPQQTLSPTGVRVIHLTDVEQGSAVFSNWQGRFEQLSSGRFEGTIRVVRGRAVRVVAVESNQRALLQGRDAAGLCSVYPVVVGNAGSIWQGRRFNPGRLVVHGTAAETNHCSARHAKQLGVSLRPETLEEAARSLHNSDDISFPHTWASLSPPPAAFAELTQYLALLLKSGMTD